MASSASTTAGLTPQTWTSRAVFTIIVLGLSAGVQLSDQGVQSLSLSAMQRAFGVSDAALGAVQGLAGFFVGSLFAIPLSRLVDKFSRKLILLCLITASTTMMVLSAFAPTFELFFLGRSSAGILEFAMIPLVYSMIPDLSPEKDRVLANLGFAAIMAAGASGGYYFGAAIIGAGDAIFPFSIEPWRKGFLLISLSGLPLLLLALLTLDPPRYPGFFASSGPVSIGTFLSQRRRVIVLFLGVAGCLLVAVQALNQLIALALERRFEADIASIGQAMGVILLIVSAGSIPAAGLLDRLFARRFARASRPAVMGFGVSLAVPASFMLVATSNVEHAYILVGVFMFSTATANALIPTMLQDLVPPPLRARSFAVWSFLVSIFSASGPLLAGALSDAFLQNDLLPAIILVAIPALSLSALSAARLILELSD